MSDLINSTGSGVVHGHIHNYDNLTYIHGHVHHTTHVTNDTYDHNHQYQNKNINNSNNNDDNNALLTHGIDQNNLQLHEHCKPFEFFDFHNNNKNNNGNAYNVFDNHDHISNYKNSSPFTPVPLDLPFTYHQSNNSNRIKRKFEELDDNILSNTSIKKHQLNNANNHNSNNNYTINNIEDDCNPKIFEICCDIDHHNTLSSDTIKKNDNNKDLVYNANVTSFNKDAIMINTLNNDFSSANSHLMNNNNTDQNTTNVFDLQNKIKYLSDLNCTFDCNFDCANINKTTNHGHDSTDSNNNNNNNNNNNTGTLLSDSFDRYCQSCYKNEPHEQHGYDSKPIQSQIVVTPARVNSTSSSNSIATTIKNNDMSILQDLCNISSLYEVPFAQHMSHCHSHSHTHARDHESIFNQQIQIQNGTKDIDNTVTEYDNISGEHSSASNLLEPVINSSLLNKTANTKSNNNRNEHHQHRQHHHHKIELHTHTPMINNYTVLDNKTRQTILNNAIKFHIDSKTDPIKERKEAEYNMNMDMAMSLNELNTIDFNWNYRRDKDKDMRCLWDDCDNEYKFDNLIDLQKHMFVDHIPGDNDYSCHWQDCLFHGNDVCSLVNHINDHHGINFGIKVKEPTHLPVAMVKKEKEEDKMMLNNTDTTNEYKCQWGDCRVKFNTKKELNEHIERDHIPRRRSQYKCNWSRCNKDFNQRQKLIRHIKVHTGYKPHKCDICDKTFANQETLIQHKRIHSGEKPYKCDICGKCFGGSSSLKIHIRTHTGEKPLKCHICDKRFNESSNLNKHLKTHLKEFGCQKCGKRFSTLKYLKQHESAGNCIKRRILNV